MGMKKIPYWLTLYTFNLIITTFPLIIGISVGSADYIQPFFNYLLYPFLTLLFLISFSYFLTIFISLNHIYIIVLPLMVAIFYQTYFLLISIDYISQLGLIVFFMPFSLGMVLLFFICDRVTFKYKNRKRYVQAESKNVQRLI